MTKIKRNDIEKRDGRKMNIGESLSYIYYYTNSHVLKPILICDTNPIKGSDTDLRFHSFIRSNHTSILELLPNLCHKLQYFNTYEMNLFLLTNLCPHIFVIPQNPNDSCKTKTFEQIKPSPLTC